MAKFIYNDFEPPTTEVYIPRVLERVDCETHSAEHGQPCYDYESAIGESRHIGVCNQRARQAGIDGAIKFSSLRTTHTSSASSRADG